jgi:PAS domain S-box-containing protein
MNGLEFLDAVRDRWPNLPFILYTSVSDEAVVTEAISAGATTHVRKGTGADHFGELADRIREAVSESRDRSSYADVFEKTSVGLTIHDVDTYDVVDANHRFCNLLGYEERACRGNSLADLSATVDGYSPERVRTQVETAIETGSNSFEVPLQTRAGELVWSSVTLERAEIGGRDRLLGTVRDVTTHKEQERQLSTLISNLPGIVYRCRNERGWPMELVRGDTAAIVGYDADRLESGEVDWGVDVVHPDDREAVWTAVQEAVDGGEPFTLTYRVRTADDDERWVWEQGRAVQAANGDVEALEGFITDVTERKERERALAALHEAATDLEAAEGEWEVYGRLVEAAEEILDFDLVAVDVVEGGALVQRAWSLDLEDGDYFEQTPLDEDSFATRAYKRGETIVTDDVRDYDVTPADPEYRSALTVPISGVGTFQAVSRDVAAFDDVDRELAELLVDHARSTLDRLDHQRSMREQRERLRRENERLEEFAHVVSHDLRNPLSVATAELDRLTSTCDSPHLDEIELSLDRMAAIVDDVLEMARQGTIVDDDELEAVDVGALAERCWTTVASADATLAVETTATIRADADRLRRALENLFRNAVDHGGDDVRIRIGALDGDGDAGGGGFYVADDGPGIPPDEREAVFDPGHSGVETGTGFGLAIVDEIVRAHDWTIEITESDDGGTRFEITGIDVA